MFDNFTVPARYVAAAAEFAPSDDTRYYLNGLCFDGRHIIATDGCAMLVAANVAERDREAPPVILELPPKFVTECRARKAADADVTFEFNLEQTGGVCFVSERSREGTSTSEAWCGPVYTFKMIDGKYPDWRKVVPRPDADEERPTTALCADGNLLGQCTKAVKILAQTKVERDQPCIFIDTPSTTHGMLVRFACDSNVIAVVMPMRPGDNLERGRGGLPFDYVPPAEVPHAAAS